MDDLLNIDDIGLKDILRQLDFTKSISDLNGFFALKLALYDNNNEFLFAFPNDFKSSDKNKSFDIVLTDKKIGVCYFESENNEFIEKYLFDFLNEAVKLGYKIYLTNNVHLKLAEESYKELEAKNKELKKANEALKELDKVKTNFLAMISHELKTPLTSIIGLRNFYNWRIYLMKAKKPLKKY